MHFRKKPRFTTKIEDVHKAVETIKSFCSECKKTHSHNRNKKLVKYASANRIEILLIKIKKELQSNFDE